MNPALEEIPSRILRLAEGALAQANMHATHSSAGGADLARGRRFFRWQPKNCFKQ